MTMSSSSLPVPGLPMQSVKVPPRLQVSVHAGLIRDAGGERAHVNCNSDAFSHCAE